MKTLSEILLYQSEKKLYLKNKIYPKIVKIMHGRRGTSDLTVTPLFIIWKMNINHCYVKIRLTPDKCELFV